MIQQLKAGARSGDWKRLSGQLTSGAKQAALHPATLAVSVPVAGHFFVSDVNADELAKGLVQPSLWLTLLVVAAFGALGGVAAELVSLHGNIERAHAHPASQERDWVKRWRRSRLAHGQNLYDLGIWSRLILGALAAIAWLALFAPGNAAMLVASSVIAGSAATGVFRLCQRRMLPTQHRRAPAKQRTPAHHHARSEKPVVAQPKSSTRRRAPARLAVVSASQYSQ